MDDAMEIDDTIEDQPIIVNKRLSDELAAKEQQQKSSDEKTVPSQSVGKKKATNDDDDDDCKIIEVGDEDKVSPPPEPPEPALESNTSGPIDIVILDDDDDKDGAENEEGKKKKYKVSCPTEVSECIDLVKVKTSVNTKCINYACKSGVNMMSAPVSCLTYYRVKNYENKKREVCRECCDTALVHFDKLAQKMVDGDIVVDGDFPIRNDLIEVDSDSDNEANSDDLEYFDDETYQFFKDNFDDVLQETIKKFNFDMQVDSSIKLLKERAEKNQKTFKEVDDMIRDVRKNLDTIHRELYIPFKTHFEHKPAISIMDNLLSNAKPVIRLESANAVQQVRNQRLTAATQSRPPHLAPLLSSQSRDALALPEFATLPPKGVMLKVLPKCGEYYYAVRYLALGSWTKVMLKNVVTSGNIVNGQAVVENMFEVTGENRQPEMMPVTRQVSGRELAYFDPNPVQLDVGARVIAIYTEANVDPKKGRKEAFYPGIVAEPLSIANGHRYLIFFDDGYVQYVYHNMVRVIYQSSPEVWEDMSPDARPFIKKYLESYPERPMVKLRKDQTVRTEYKGKWWLAKVQSIDCSLVQMSFEPSERVEWIYRGSTRLNPMYLEEQAASMRMQHKTPTPRKINPAGDSKPYVEYTRTEEPQVIEDDDDIRDSSTALVLAVPKKMVAKKSTARSILPPAQKASSAVPFLPAISKQVVNTPPPSKVVYFTPRSQKNMTTVFRKHECSPKCKLDISYDVSKLKGYNPLSKPLLCGWNRVTLKCKGNKRVINYKAPCGRFVRNMQELHRYLRLTDSDMTVDLFDFDFWVHCLAEFVLERNVTINKDLSGGLEPVAIPVVNYVDMEVNQFCNYSTKREPMEGVNLNLDPDFLCGCDCTDDCADKTKCACWKLTLEGLPYLQTNTSPEYIGYMYRRLPEPVITGIYECNSRCKCGKTCLNRVVQNPLQLKLQVFKTNNRGWGIRCLNDIPQGAFICIYAGSLLTDTMGNEGGKNYGDEYLAELDYIEVVEAVKEDYEEEVVEPESIEDRSPPSRKQESESEDEDDDDGKERTRSKGRRRRKMDDQNFNPGIPDNINCDFSESMRTRLRRRGTEESSEPKEEVKKKEKTKEEQPAAENGVANNNTSTNGGEKNGGDVYTILSDEEEVREPSSFNPKDNVADEKPPKYPSVRELFGEDENVYVMDAKVTGNIGRFLNHSCSPNVFVQNVFVDSHDLRFPWVAFFALSYIRAGTELTWNYNYDVGSVAGKVLYCQCASAECRGRLL